MKISWQEVLKFISTKFKELRDSLGNKVDKVENKQLSTNDYTNEAKAKVDAIPDDPKYTDTVPDLSGYATKSSVPTSLSQLSEDSTHRVVSDTEKTAWNDKVDKVQGKQLSTNDFTNDYKNTVDTLKNTSLSVTSNSADLNTLTKAGFYSCRGCANRPANANSYGTLIVSKADLTVDSSQTDTVQFYIDKDNDVYTRNSIDLSNTWTDWVQLGGHATKILTESEYNGLSTKDANTLYFIK